jgi:3D (Asp-Asp-Asp) domain-containing protein
MQIPAARVIPLALCLLATGCATKRKLPKYERPLARTPVQSVRTTAYTHTEGDHLQYSNRNASGGRLQAGSVKSAACDWSRWPVGTTFRIRETGENFIVDDYGWALTGTNTIDLYKPSRSAMNAWGVRRVTIELIEWGDVQRSLAILQPRAKHEHVRLMVRQIKSRYAELSKPLPGEPSDPVAVVEPASPSPSIEPAAPVASAAPVARAVPAAPVRAVAVASRTSPGGFVPPPASRVPLVPFSAPTTAPR